MSQRATGHFDVTLTPQPLSDEGTAAALGRRSIDKRFHGDLEATSKGEMVSFVTAIRGSAAYVALELVTGTVGGRRGSFALRHAASMARGAPSLSIEVVPDSGTEQLVGLRGTMSITITDGHHAYGFDYSFDAPA